MLLFFLLDCVRQIFDCHALTGVKNKVWALNDAGDVEPADKAVVDDNALRSVLALSLDGKDLNFLNKLSQEYRR